MSPADNAETKSAKSAGNKKYILPQITQINKENKISEIRGQQKKIYSRR